MIQELMLINQAGIALFYHNFLSEKNLDDHQSLASYFDVICRFTKQNFKESLKSLTLDNFFFFFYTHKSHYHLVLKCDYKNLDEKTLESFSKIIVEAFLTKFIGILEDFNGEISLFKSFTDDIEEIVNSKLENFRKFLILEN